MRLIAFRLRQEGFSYDEIAEEMEIESELAYKYIQDHLAFLKEMKHKEIEDQLLEDLARLDEGLKAVMPKVRDGQLSAVDRLIKILDRRARYFGLDKDKSEVDVNITLAELVMASQSVEPEREKQLEKGTIRRIPASIDS